MFVAQVEYGDLSVEARGGTGDQRFFQLRADAVDCVARGEIVAAIEYHVGAGGQLQQAGFVRAFAQRDDAGFGVDCRQRVARGFSFGFSDRGGVVQKLALQIGEIDGIAVAYRQRPHAAGGEEQRRRTAQAARADNQRVSAQPFLLSFDADFGQQDVAAIAEELLVVHRSS